MKLVEGFAQRSRSFARAGAGSRGGRHMSMSKLESVSTAGLDPRKRLDFWNAAVSTNVIAAAADPLDRAGFCGLLKRCDVDSIRLAEISSVSASVNCAPTDDAHVLLQLMLSGSIVCRSSGVDR